MTAEIVELTCVACGVEGPHHLVMAGRLLQSTHCLNCGHELRHEQRDLMSAYLWDLEHRLLTKPRRMALRALREPLTFARQLPGAVTHQPAKLLRELRALFYGR
jgi:hypothetical protein